MPVSVKDERITIYLEINKLEEITRLDVYARRQPALPQSAQNCRELASRLFFLHRKRTEFIWLIHLSRESVISGE
ncbi:MAG: hypothetical protein Q8N04_14800 [Nitrospira sp.]|nr:hypothetical protein [Nitrospira sp.]